jgi:hypothetical protein
MRALLTILIVLFSPLSSIWGQADSIKIDVQADGESAFRTINQISKNYQISFIYDAGAMRSLRLNCKYEDIYLRDFLLKELVPLGWTYKKVENRIAIVPMPGKQILPETIESKKQISMSAIRGKVVDANTGDPLPFANCFIEGLNISTESGEDGQFQLKTDLPDSLVLRIHYIGYNAYRTKLSSPYSSGYYIFRLDPASTYLPSAVIADTALPVLISGDISGVVTIQPKAVSASQTGPEQDVIRSVQLLPGVNGTLESSSGINIRGGAPDETLMRVDGFTLYHLDHLFGLISSVNPHAVRSLKIRKGIQSSSESGRASGILDITTREGSGESKRLVTEITPLAFSMEAETPLAKNGRTLLMVAARKSLTDVLITPTYTALYSTLYNNGLRGVGENYSTTLSSESGKLYSFGDLNVKLSFRPASNDLITFSAYGGFDNFQTKVLQGGQQSRYTLTQSNNGKWGSTGISTRWFHTINDQLQFQSVIGLSQYRSQFFGSDIQTDQLFGDSTSRYNSDALDLRDLNIKAEFIQQSKLGKWHFGAQLNSVVIDHKILNAADQEQLYQTDTLKQQAEVVALFSDKHFQWGSNKILIGGRINYYNLTNSIIPEWRLIGTKKVKENHLLKLSAGRTIQWIHRIYQQNIFLGNADFWRLSDGRVLPILYCDQISAGWNYARKILSLDIEIFAKKNSGSFLDLGVYSFVKQSDQRIISGSGKTSGVEASLQLTPRHFELLLCYTYLNAVSKFTSLAANSIPVSLTRRHEVKSSVTYRYGNWSIGVTHLLGSGLPYTPLLGSVPFSFPDGNTVQLPVYGQINSARLPIYNRLDASFIYRWNTRVGAVGFRLSGINILNNRNIITRRYIEQMNGAIGQRDVGMLGRILSIGVEWMIEQ